MARVTKEEVEEIIDIDSAITSIAGHITGANQLVTAKLSNVGYTAAQLKEIERWVAAHFVCIQDPRTKQEAIGSSQATFERPKVGVGLNGTSYGQTALLLDTSGLLGDTQSFMFKTVRA